MSECASLNPRPLCYTFSRPIQMLRWLCLLSLSLPLLFWFGHMIRRDDPSPAVQSTGLKGYMRIAPGRMDQV